MPYIKDGPRVTRHISFSPREDSLIRGRADRAGMGVCPYIRSQALEGRVQEVNWDVMHKHQTALDTIATSVQAIANRPHPNRMEYEADLETIQHMLSEVTALDAEILESLQRI